MMQFLNSINYQKKLSPEQHIVLWLYDMYRIDNPEISYEDYIITEGVIKEFNRSISDNMFRARFNNYINQNRGLVNTKLDHFRQEPWKYSKPVIWNDRKKSDYYIKNLMLSHKFETFIDHKFLNEGIDIGLYYSKEGQYDKGESELGIEIKYDMRSLETGNLYIEYSEKSNPDNETWVKSGIFKKDNTKYFITGTEEKFWVLDKEDLKDLYDKINQNNCKHNGCQLKKAKQGTSLGFIIPKRVADEMTMNFENLIEKIRQDNI